MACTRILWNQNNRATVVARTMDLFRSDEARLVASPQALKRTSTPASGPSLNWTSKYGSVVVTAFDVAVSDGINERGLVANLLYLGTTKYEARDERPGLSNALMVQYVLDSFTTVAEALAALNAVQIVSVQVAGREWPLHLSMSDASGDSAVVEFIDGKMVVHHGREYTVMTNEPALSTQLANLQNYKLFGGSKALPGDIDPMSRFVRAASFLKTLPEAKTLHDTVAGIYGVAKTVSVPRGAEDTSGSNLEDAWPTLWFALSDSTNKTYYFQPTTAPNLYWIDLTKLDFNPGAPVRSVDAYDLSLSGDITAQLMASK